MISQRDDLPHEPHQWALMTWKENWCFTGVDVATGVGFVFHVSLRPQFGEGIFSAKLDGTLDGERVRIKSVERHPIGRNPAEMPEIASTAMRVEILEPHRRFRLSYVGEAGSLVVDYEGRFAPFDFADGAMAPGASTLGDIGRHVFPFHHYEQGLTFTATLVPAIGAHAGRTITLAGVGNRDHSWGWRDDFGFRLHHWVCANFADRFVQGSAMHERSYDGLKHGGFISSRGGNVAVMHVDTSNAYWESPANEPLPPLDRPVTYRLRDAHGEEHVVTALLDRAVARNFLNARKEDGTAVYEDCQMFCEYRDERTGEVGAGILEVGKILERPDAVELTRRN